MNLSFIQDENAIESIDGISYEFPYTMHERDLTNFTVPWHWHEELEFNYAYKGSIIIETINQIYTIHQGEAYFINTNVMNTKRKADGISTAIEHAHLFHPILLTGYYRSIFETKYLNPILKNQSVEVIIIKENTAPGKKFLQLLHKLTALNSQPDCEFQIRNLLSESWITLTEEIQLQKKNAPAPNLYQHELTKNMLSYLQKHYADKLSLSDLSAQVGLSEKECVRIFKSAFHQTPIDYLIEYRIEQAKRLLKQADEPITNIAYRTGFNNSAYFSKTFKKYTGITPKEYQGL